MIDKLLVIAERGM